MASDFNVIFERKQNISLQIDRPVPRLC